MKESLEAMPPVSAGRFVVYGGHDRGRIRANQIGIEIEAAQAFGTGHHGTTWGCLKALDTLLKARRYERPLDIGTGTGVLAIGLAKALRRKVVATEIDPVATRIAVENARLNGVSALIEAHTADGVKALPVTRHAPYDLIVANILANPLVALAPDVERIAADRASVVLSGLLTWQRREVEAVWRTRGFVARDRLFRDGWATLVLQRRSAGAYRS
ncbi:Ribosomal protein L11 methyltransferase [Lutibaculum baratangense AMV1]|uniref:Ribosomal protein L11 methyltransferase n=1 Tax=Lutibaculum baratangense AMV1 TaxID=631454 RepID=V4RWB8_9HYPH|nr:Ribosomal protein L11 methyltransferase [Lutibaculum baratangense AMV1]